MAKFLTTKGISYRLEEIIKGAKKHLTLVSPYLDLSKTFYERLKDASNRKVVIRIVYGKDELKPNKRNSLADLKTVELYYFENLHAKCYYNEEEMIIGSMNMYAFSEANNREMAVFIDRKTDNDLFNEAKSEVESIMGSSQKQILPVRSATPAITYKITVTDRGYCIRCEERIPFNPDKPLCTDCYTSWSKYENYTYGENVCHECGEYETTSMEKPQCYSCYSSMESQEPDVSAKSSLSVIHTELMTCFPEDKITNAKTYLYFNSILPSLDAMIHPDKIILKYQVKDSKPSFIKKLTGNLETAIRQYHIQLIEPKDGYRYFTWNFDLKNGSSTELKHVITSLRKVK